MELLKCFKKNIIFFMERRFAFEQISFRLENEFIALNLPELFCNLQQAFFEFLIHRSYNVYNKWHGAWWDDFAVYDFRLLFISISMTECRRCWATMGPSRFKDALKSLKSYWKTSYNIKRKYRILKLCIKNIL